MPKPEGRAKSQILILLIWFVPLVALTIAYNMWHPPVLSAFAHWFSGLTEQSARVENPWLALALDIASIFLMFFVVIAIHEVGHVMAGLCTGFHFNSLRVGPVQFDRGFRVSLYRGRKTGAGGWASVLPVKHDHLAARAIVMLLGGPGANLLSVAVVAALQVKGTFVAQFVFLSLLLGLLNLVPFRSRAVYSDGGRILMLLANRARGERWLAMLKLLDEMRRGVAPAAMSKEFVAKAVALEDKSPDTIAAHAIAHSVAFWTRNDEEAARTLEVCLRHAAMAAPIQRQALASTAAVFQARRRKRVDLAEQWLAELPEKTEMPWTRPWSEAAILEGKGDVAGTRKKLDEIDAVARKWPNEAVRIMILNSLERWRGELAS